MSAARTGRARRSATPLVLIVLAAGAVAYAYFVDRAQVSDAERAARRTDVFPSFRVEDVRRVEITHGAETLVLDRVLDREPPAAPGSNTGAQPSWVMSSPRRDPTDPVEVDALLRELDTATRVRDVADDDARGLDAPRVRGSVAVGPIGYRFALGDDALAPAGAAYMRVDGEGTFVVGRALKVQLLRGADAYRERAIVPYGAGETARLEVSGPGASFVLERRGTSFRVGGHDGLRASRDAVDHLFEALAEARAESFVDDTPAERALGPAARVVVLTPRDAARPRVRLVVGGDCPSPDAALAADVVVLRTEPARAAACVAKGLAEALALALAPDALVDAGPFAAHADEIEELAIEPAGDARPRVDIARRGSGWHERAPVERDLGVADADSADALVAALAGARALQVRRGEPGERLVPRSRVTLVRTGSESSEVVEVAAPSTAGVALARRVDDGAFLVLPRAIARRFEPHPIALDGADIWPSPVDPAEIVAIDDTCSRPSTRLTFADGEWKGESNDGGGVDSRSVSDLADAFARARADAWLVETDDGTFGFGRDASCAVTLTLAPAVDGGAPHRVGVVFGDEGDGGIYARATDRAGVFIAPATLRALAADPEAQRSGLRLEP
jgi:hypothetical protein